MLSSTLVDPIESTRSRWRMRIEGLVQGVGFRPFAYRCAIVNGLSGWVANSADGVDLEVEGSRRSLESFVHQLHNGRASHSRIDKVEIEEVEVLGDREFSICSSVINEGPRASIPVDVATCRECVAELFDRSNRRYRYPFITCSHCGPRYTIVESLPYDRSRTSMQAFAMCAACKREYSNSTDRRYHAETIACPTCGPQLQFRAKADSEVLVGESALQLAVVRIRAGEVIAIKSLGGYQLLADARSDGALKRLRDRKHRPEKPFAIMCASLDQARELCEVSSLESEVLQGRASPIVLLQSNLMADDKRLSEWVAPRSRMLGVMLPFTPLHCLLMSELQTPLVATSGNVSDDPIIFDDQAALERLSSIADGFLTHDRVIARSCDDSVVRVMAESPVMFRRARGYSSQPIATTVGAEAIDKTVLAGGGFLKNTVALLSGDRAYVSAYVGDLGSHAARDRREANLTQLTTEVDRKIDVVASDLHPDFVGVRTDAIRGGWVPSASTATINVQHHVAHIASCIGEHSLQGPVLGIAWDGAGYGSDGTLWGGEFIAIEGAQWRRVAHLRPFPLPGGEQAIREPRRCALGVLYAMCGDACSEHPFVRGAFLDSEIDVLLKSMQRALNAPMTSSIGRLFDAVAALCGLRDRSSYDGQAAMELEATADEVTDVEPYSMAVREVDADGSMILDWSPMLESLVSDVSNGERVGQIAARFQWALARAAALIAKRIGIAQVALGGGCFQNRFLLEQCVKGLQREGLKPYWPAQLPPNDGGLSFGQAVWARRMLEAHVKCV